MKKYLWVSIVISATISSIIIATFIYHSFKNEKERIFFLQTQLLDNKISRKIQLTQTVLKNYQTLFHTRDVIDPDMFRIFSKDILTEYPYMNQFHYAPRVKASDKENFEEEKNFLGYFNYTIKPFDMQKSFDNKAEVFFPTLYIEPFTPKNSRALGLDIYSNPNNTKAIEESIATGNIAISMKQNDGSINLFVPVYNDKGVPLYKEERKERINGIISLTIFLDDLVSDLKLSDKMHFLMVHRDTYNSYNLIEKFEAKRFDLLRIFELEKDHIVYIDNIEIDLHFSRAYQLYDISYKTMLLGLAIMLFIVFSIYYLLKKHLALKEELAKSIKQENMLIQQSKLASMGEMIGNIAHQWRQPLAQLSAIHMNMKVTYDFEKFTKEYLKEKLKEANELTSYMSHTISDFQNFFKPKGDKEDFSVKTACTNSYHILESAFSYHSIKVNFNIKQDSIVNGYQNEYAQVFLNILSNAKDILIEREIETPMINVTIKQTKEGNSQVMIEDNAGGIDEAILDKIFEPYFTTRHKTQGTGIGLYMSKNIIERNMNGSIQVENTNQGALFIIEVKALA